MADGRRALAACRVAGGRAVCFAALLVALLPAMGSAHESALIRLDGVFDPDDATFELTLNTDRDMALLTLAPEARRGEDRERVEEIRRHLAALDPAARLRALGRLRTYVAKAVRIRFGEETVLAEVAFPDAVDLRAEPPAGSEGILLGRRAVLRGGVPRGGERVSFAVAPRFGNVLLSLRWRGETGQSAQHLAPGAESAPFDVTEQRALAGRAALLASYLALGYQHILPLGADHILFVLGLCLLSARLRPLLWQVSAFTLAHSVTLALSIYGFVRIASGVVEPLIALSIAFVAVENVFVSELKPWRPLVVFGFGLIHGLGFAGVLSRLDLPTGELLPALLAFNAGVELGQLTVIGAMLATVGWLRGHPRYRSFVSIPGSIAIASVGLLWVLQRVLG